MEDENKNPSDKLVEALSTIPTARVQEIGPGIKVVEIQGGKGQGAKLLEALGLIPQNTVVESAGPKVPTEPLSAMKLIEEFDAGLVDLVNTFMGFTQHSNKEEEALTATAKVMAQNIGFTLHMLESRVPGLGEKIKKEVEILIERGQKHAKQHDEEGKDHVCPPDLYKVD